MGVTRVECEQGGKRGQLTGCALSEEVLNSSRSVLSPGRPGGALRGLQQFFTPREAAELIKQVIDPYGRLAVRDPAAGNGAPLARWRREQRFGIEIDGDHVRGGGYEAILGDLQRAYPMLAKLGVRFSRVVVNPPFGLTWTDSTGRAEGSAAGAWRMGIALLEDHGVGAFICGRDRFGREILPREDAAGVFATVDCEDLFADVALPCLIAFFVHRENRAEPPALGEAAGDAHLASLPFPQQRSRAREAELTLGAAADRCCALRTGAAGPPAPWLASANGHVGGP